MRTVIKKNTVIEGKDKWEGSHQMVTFRYQSGVRDNVRELCKIWCLQGVHWTFHVWYKVVHKQSASGLHDHYNYLQRYEGALWIVICVCNTENYIWRKPFLLQTCNGKWSKEDNTYNSGCCIQNGHGMACWPMPCFSLLAHPLK